MPRNRNVWAIVPAFERSVLEKVGGKTLLETAIRSAQTGRNPTFQHLVVGTCDEVVEREARRCGADLPRRTYVDDCEIKDLRSRAFHVADFLVAETTSRIWRWGIPDSIVAFDPAFPFKSYATLADLYVGSDKFTMSVPVVDVYPGLVSPVWCMFSHVYSPAGSRPHEDYSRFFLWNRKRPFSINMVRIGALSEMARFNDGHVQEEYNKLLNNRAFRLSFDIGDDQCYVPTENKSWGAYIPKDAAYVYDAAKDVRVFNHRNGHRSNGHGNEIGRKVLQ